MVDKPAADRVSLKWKPPKPTLVDALMQNPAGLFAEDAFMEYVKRTFFVNCGLAMSMSNVNEFVHFKSKILSHGPKMFCPIVDWEMVGLLSDSGDDEESTDSSDNNNDE